MWEAVLARIRASGAGECDAQGGLEQALPAAWVDATFASARQRQFPRALLMSTVIELMLPVALGLQRLV